MVAYDRGFLISVDTIYRMNELAFYRAMEPVSLQLLKRIQEGAMRSEHTTKKLRDLVALSLI